MKKKCLLQVECNDPCRGQANAGILGGILRKPTDGNRTAYFPANRETLLIDKADTRVTHLYGERMDLYRENTPLWKR